MLRKAWSKEKNGRTLETEDTTSVDDIYIFVMPWNIPVSTKNEMEDREEELNRRVEFMRRQLEQKDLELSQLKQRLGDAERELEESKEKYRSLKRKAREFGMSVMQNILKNNIRFKARRPR